jgi:ABC-type sugar transport system ATPase subunit
VRSRRDNREVSASHWPGLGQNLLREQKVVIAKSLVQDPSIVIFDEPTRGVDVGTIPDIHAQILGLAGEGKAVVVISSYLPEVLSISDRILVARLGHIVAEFDAAAATEEKIMYAAIH